jgi:hypothetical protein
MVWVRRTDQQEAGLEIFSASQSDVVFQTNEKMRAARTGRRLSVSQVPVGLERTAFLAQSTRYREESD